MRRVIPQFAKVEGHESFVRDMSSHAIVSTNDDEFTAYQRKRFSEKKTKTNSRTTVARNCFSKV